MTLTILFCTTAWVLGWWAFGRPRDLTPDPAPGPRPAARLSIVIPARNEELSLPGLLGDLARQRPDGCEVIVVDDHSTDETRRIAADHPFVELVDAPELPEGWTGKCWACHTGAERASGDVLVFLDADVRLAPGALEALLARLDERGGLVSVQPWHDTERPYEQASALFNVIAVMGTAVGSAKGPTGAFGPVLATRAADYRSVGGHAAVRDEVVEDLALAGRYRAAGLPVAVFTGGESVRFRMYPAGLRQLAEGWSKNFASGAVATRPARLAAIMVWVTGLGTAAVWLGDGLRGTRPIWVAAALYAAFVAQSAALFRRVGRFGAGTAVLFPLLLAFFFVTFARSLWATRVRRSVQWRGRRVPVGASRG